MLIQRKMWVCVDVCFRFLYFSIKMNYCYWKNVSREVNLFKVFRSKES